jgi:hypothetical protein
LIDGKTVLSWQGDYRRLSHDPKIGRISDGMLFLGASNVTVEKLELAPLGVSASRAPSSSPRPSVPQQRHPLPTPEQQQASLTLIQDVFQKEYDGAKSKSDKAELGTKLFTQARQTPRDLSGRYMLYRESRRLATLAGDSVTALRSADALGREFDIDREKMILETIEALSKTVQFTPQRIHLAENALALIDTAVAEHRYDTIEELTEIALATARASRDKDLLKKVVDRRRELEEVSKAYALAEKSLETLKEKPDDPQANLIAGRFVCLILNDWPRGLPMLAQGSDPQLKSLATDDLASPQEGMAMASLGDRWVELAASLEGLSRQSARQRATEYYRQAIGRLNGLSKALVEKKLAAIPEN